MTAQPAFVHPLALVEAGASLGAGVRIGPFCTVGAEVELGAGVELVSHAVVAGRTRIGARTKIHPFAALGLPPQDRKYAGEASRLEVGPDCVIREGATLHPGTRGGGMVTRLGAGCLVMAQAHVGHDCEVGDHVVLSNNVMLAGHVRVGDHVVLGGGVGVIQYARVGAHAFVGGMSGLEGDLVPYGLAVGNRARLVGLNLVGLRRRHFPKETVAALRRAWRMLFAEEGGLSERLDDVEAAFACCPEAMEMAAFLRAAGDRPICRPAAPGA